MIKFTLTLARHINLSKIINIKKIQLHFGNNQVDIIQYFNQKFLFQIHTICVIYFLLEYVSGKTDMLLGNFDIKHIYFVNRNLFCAPFSLLVLSLISSK